MKRINSWILILVMIAICIPTLAIGDDADIFAKFQPYTDVKLDVLQNAGFTTSFDNFKFNAEFYPPDNKMEVEDSYDKYRITMDIKAVYSTGKALLVPRLIFYRSGLMTYYDDRMSDVYIRNGENRYHVDLSGVSRSSSTKNSTATDSCVEPLRLRGIIMLADLAQNPLDVSVQFGTVGTMNLTADHLKAIKVFYDTCKEAGIFDQEELHAYVDDYSIVTLFNAGSSGTEDAVEEIGQPAPEEGSEQAEGAE